MTVRLGAALLLPLSLCVLPSCAVAAAEDTDAREPRGEGLIGQTAEPLTVALPTTRFDDAAKAQSSETWVIITSLAQYVSIVGHAPPVSVDWSREWVAFYSAGTRPTGGYDAAIDPVSFNVEWWAPPRLYLQTRLRQPGSTCLVPEIVTVPQAFAKFRRPPVRPQYALAFPQYEVRSCPTNPCAAVSCPVDTSCEVDEGEAVCVPHCGGFPGTSCPGVGTCVDDPGDDCDPTAGGRDCGGLCRCNAIGRCPSGYHWSTSPAECACIPD